MARVCASVLGVVLLAGAAGAAGPGTPSDERGKAGYSIGFQIGGDLQRQGLEVDPELLVQGLRDALAGTEPRMTPDDMRQTLVALRNRAAAAQRQQQEEQGRANQEAGKAFLAGNASQEGVVTLPSGLQYQVLTEGAGAAPQASDTVSVHYRGTLIDGTEFDSSYGRGQPATFQLDRVIKGWTEGVQLMRPGSKYRFFIPPELAYGERGAGPQIGPNSTLIFEVELLEVK